MMPSYSIYFELTRPNADIPWAHKYIINSTDEKLNKIKKQHSLLKAYSQGQNGLTAEYLQTDNENLIMLKITYAGATAESVNHVALLHYKKMLPLIKDWEQWSIEYNKMWGITKTKIYPHNTRSNSILNNGDYGSTERFKVRFQTHT